MQNRRDLYYQGNTVTLSRPGRKNLEKRQALPTLGGELKAYTYEHKVAACHACRFCGNEFETYRIRCNACGTCQWCGTICPSSQHCTTCGNRLPPELEVPHENRRIIVT